MVSLTPILAAASLALMASVAALDNGLGLTPPMGWNSWNNFHENIDEVLIREVADAMVSTGVRDMGYVYLNLDDYWMAPQRDPETGRLVGDPVRFPSGIKALADYVHSRGLKFGVYSSSGTKTCGGLPASLNNEVIDAQTFADWGVDYLKLDNCNHDLRLAHTRFANMRDALNATGRPIFFSICSWGQEFVYSWGAEVGNSWRTTLDIKDQFTGFNTIFDKELSITTILDRNKDYTKYAGPGGWNDVDMLEVGVGNLTPDENRAHFALWAALKSPLIIGADLRSISAEALAILTNPEILAVNQDPLGKSVSLIRNDGNIISGHKQVWAGPLADGSQVVILFNRQKNTVDMSVKFEELGFPARSSARIRDLNDRVDLGVFTGSFSSQVRTHAAVVVRVWPLADASMMVQN